MQSQQGFWLIVFGVSEAGTFDRSKFAAYEFFNLPKLFVLIAGDKGNRVSCGFCPAGPANAMNVILRNDGDIEIDDM